MYHETRSVYSDIHLPSTNNLVSPRPITDRGLRKALKKDEDLARLKVPPKDEKILALMTQRGEDERKYWKGRLKRSMAWDDERLDSERLRDEKERTHRQRVEITRDEDRQKVQINKLERQKRRLKKKDRLLSELEQASKATEKQLRKQNKIKAIRQKELTAKEEEHKENQDKNWWEVNSREYEKRLQEKLDHDKKRLQAWEKRDEHIKDEVQRIAKENEEERMYYTKRYVVYEKKAKANQKALVSKIEHRMTTVQANHDQQTKKRIEEIKEDALKEEERLHHALKTQHKIEKQNHKRLKKMLQKTQEDIEKANTTLAQAFEEHAEQIRTERENRAKEQKKQMKKHRKEQARWVKQIKRDMRERDKRTREKQEERNSVMEQTRTVAHDTRVLRNKVLDTYGAEDFDKKLFRVQRFHSLGTRPSTQDWNQSSISLL